MFPDMKPNEAVNEIKLELEDLIDQMRFQLIQPFRARFHINSLPTSGDFNHLLLTFANRLDVFLAWAGSNLLDTDDIPKRNFPKMLNKKNPADYKSACKTTRHEKT